MSYLDNLMQNNQLDSASPYSQFEPYSDKLELQEGGKREEGKDSNGEEDRPTGGFPPIYKCSQASSEEVAIFVDTQETNREYDEVKKGVSVKDIIDKRRKNVPFI